MWKATAVLGAALVTLAACNPGTPVACRAGSPRAIFRADDAGVAEHSFTSDANDAQLSVESVTFADGSHLDIEQFGCDTLGQSFILTLPNAPRIAGWPEWRDLAVTQFRHYGELEDRLLTFGEYARALESVPKDFPMPQPANLAPGLTLRAYPVPGRNGSVWQADLVQELQGAEGM